MVERQLNFLSAVLGQEGVTALSKAIDESTALNAFLIPRTVISWISNLNEFNGSLPGVDDLNIEFNKSENGFTGKVGSYEFIDKSLTHLTAHICMLIGVDGKSGSSAKGIDLEKLGKSLDLLVKTKTKKDKKPEDLKVEKALEASEKELQKVAPEGQVKDAAPVAPQAPMATDKTPAQKPPKLPKAGATVSLNRSEMNHACPMCAGKQFDGDKFVGCPCFSDLKKSIEILHVDELGIVIHINESMEDIITLLEAIGRQ